MQQSFLGQIFDPEGDRVFCASWRIEGGDEYSWITFKNSTNINRLYFEYAPPADMEDFEFEIKLTLVDTNVYTARTEVRFSVYFRQKEVDINDLVKRQATQETAPPYLIFEDIDFEDNLLISFTEAMEYPNGIEFFRSDNLGAESF